MSCLREQREEPVINLTSSMGSLKHNQPQLSVVLFNPKNTLDFSIQPLLPPPPPMVTAGVKSLAMPCHKIFRLRRYCNSKILYAFASFLIPSDSLQAEFFLPFCPNKSVEGLVLGEKLLTIYLAKNRDTWQRKKGILCL